MPEADSAAMAAKIQSVRYKSEKTAAIRWCVHVCFQPFEVPATTSETTIVGLFERSAPPSCAPDLEAKKLMNRMHQLSIPIARK